MRKLANLIHSLPNVCKNLGNLHGSVKIETRDDYLRVRTACFLFEDVNCIIDYRPYISVLVPRSNDRRINDRSSHA